MRLDDFADRLGDRVEDIRVSLEGSDDVAVVDARRSARWPGRSPDSATRRGLLVVYPWSTADDVATASMPPGWVAWGDVRASTVQTSPGEGTPGTAPASRGLSTATLGVARHSCTIMLRGVGLTAEGDGDLGRRAVDAFHDEVVRRGTPWHYPS